MRKATSVLIWCCACSIAGLAPWLDYETEAVVDDRGEQRIASPSGCVPAADPDQETWQPVMNITEREDRHNFRCSDGLEIQILRATFSNRDGKHEAISSRNRFVSRGSQQRFGTIVRKVGSHRLNEFKQENHDGQIFLVWQWYAIDGAISHHPIRAKLREFFVALRLGRPDTTIYAIAATWNTSYALPQQPEQRLRLHIEPIAATLLKSIERT